MAFPLCVSQTLTVPSWLPDAMYLLSGDHATPSIKAVWLSYVVRDCPFVAFSSVMIPSEPPAATVLPSGDHATAKTKRAIDACQNCSPVCALQTCTVPSLPLEASFLPSGDHETEITAPVCPQ